MARQPADKVDEEEAKRQRKAAKKAAKEAAAAAEAAAEEEEVDEAEAKRQRKAAKKAAKEAAAAAEAAAEEEEAEVDEAEAKRQRKAAKKAAKAAAAAEEEEVDETPKRAKGEKRAAVLEEAPEAKRSKKGADDAAVAVEDKELKVFIKGLPYSVEESALRSDFGECGEIASLQLPMEDGRPKGFAFITFATREGFAAALKYDSTDYGGRTIGVEEAKPGGKGKDGKGKSKGKAADWTCPKCGDLVFARNDACRGCGTGRPGGPIAVQHDHENTVFIRGLPWAQTEEMLQQHFSKCGEIDTLRMPVNGEGRPSGIAFIKFKAAEGAEAALKLDDTEFGGRTLNVCKSGENKGKGKGKSKDKGGKDGKGKDDKGKKGKGKGKSKAPSDSFAKSQGVIVTGMGTAKTFDDSDDE